MLYIVCMYIRRSSSTRNGKTYTTAQIVEGYRDENGNTRQRILFNLGSVEKLLDKDVDNLINGFLRLKGQSVPDSNSVIHSSKSFGHLWAAMMLWKELRITKTLQRAAYQSKTEFDLVSHIKVMVLNRLDDPGSKLSLLSWLEEVYLPTIDRNSITYPNLLRAMDFLIAHKSVIEQEIADRFLSIFDSELTLCFYDLTSSYFEGMTVQENDLRKFGYSRDHRRDRRQVVIGVVMNSDGIPLAHYTFDGNTADRSTVIEVVREIRTRFRVQEVVLVADKGMTSSLNFGWLHEAGVAFIVGESKRIRRDTCEGVMAAEAFRLSRNEAERDTECVYETTGEVTMTTTVGERKPLAVRRIYSYNPATAVKQCERRQRSLDKLFELSEAIRTSNKTSKEAYHLLRDLCKRHGLSRLVTLPDDPLQEEIRINEETLSFEQQADGWFVVSATVPEKTLSTEEVIKQYKQLQMVENGFRTLKSNLDIRPMFHWNPERIRAHVFICFLALQLTVLFELRLKSMKMTFERAKQKLRQLHVIDWKSSKNRHKALTQTTPEQLEIFKQLHVPKPTTKSLVVSDF